MNLGQALAMMQYANQAKDYTNRYKATPTLDWADIASAPVDEYGATQPPVGQSIPPQFSGYPPIGEAIAGYTPPPMPDMAVAGYAPPQPPIEQRGVPAFMADQTFSELYGEPAPMPATRTMPMAFAPSSMEPTGVTGGLPAFAPPAPRMAAMPLPVPGRPVSPMTDVPAMDMPEYGRPIAMAQRAVPEEAPQIQPPTAQAEEEKPKYEPGQPFQVNLTTPSGKTISGTVQSFTPPTPNARPRAITFTPINPDGTPGTPFDIPPSNKQFYQQVDEQYRSLIGSTTPTPTENEIYKSQVKIGDNWVKARVDEDTGEVFYPIDPADPELGEAKFGKSIKDILPGENYRGPVDQYGREDNTQLLNARKRVSEFMEPTIRNIVSTATGFQGGLRAEELRQNIQPKFTPGTKDDPLGDVEWVITDPQTNEEIPIEEAENLVPEGVSAKLKKSFNDMKKSLYEIASGAKAAQSAQAPTMRQSVMDTMDQQLEQLRAEKAAATAADEINRIQALIDQKENERQNFMASNAVGLSGPGGTTVIEAPQSVTGFTLNPEQVTGMLQLISGVNPVPGQYQQGNTSQMWTLNGLIEQIKQDALKDVQSSAITVNRDYDRAIAALTNMMRRIQQDAFNEKGENASEILNEDAQFIYYDPTKPSNMAYQTVVMPYSKAIENFNSYANAYKDALSTGRGVAGALENFANAAMILNGSVRIPSLGDYRPQSNQEIIDLLQLGNVRNLIQRPYETDFSIPGIQAVAGASKTSEAPKVDTTGPRAGSTKPPKRYVTAFPLYYTPGGTQGPLRNGYESANAAFDLTERMRSDENTYKEAGIAYSKNSVVRTVRDNLSRAMFGNANDPAYDSIMRPAVKEAISKFNANIIKPDSTGKDARRAAVNMIYDMTERIGFPINYDVTDIATRLEEIYTLASNPNTTSAQIDAKIKEVFYRWKGVDTPTIRPGTATFNTQLGIANNNNNYNLTRTSSGTSVVGISDSLIAANRNTPASNEYMGSIPGSTTALGDNIQSQWYELAQLFAAAGRGKTAYRNPSGQVVTWVYDLTAPGSNLYRSVFTMPAGKRGDTDRLIPYKDAQGTKVNKDVGSEPVYSNLIMQAKDILSNNYGPLQSLMVKSADKIENVARRKYGQLGEDLQSHYLGQRPDEEMFTKWESESGDAVRKLATDSIFLGNIFGPNRNRDVFQGSTWPTFNINSAIDLP